MSGPGKFLWILWIRRKLNPARLEEAYGKRPQFRSDLLVGEYLQDSPIDLRGAETVILFTAGRPRALDTPGNVAINTKIVVTALRRLVFVMSTLNIWFYYH
jgi:hypothetical protein